MIILGIDPALRCTGYGVIRTTNKRTEVVDCGIIKTPQKESVSECLRRISGGISALIETYAPDQAAIEGGFYHKNAKTAMLLGMARGTIVSQLAINKIPVFEYAPKKAKVAVTGYGKASKQQVANVISNMLNITEEIPLDASDALSIALCHFQAKQSNHPLLSSQEI
ncbi:MAG: crossover junction endodeoxyribonuclease RuvC [Verrucomicrobiota bacterium]|nr:crossover junction endodeoxyribonuclease RuvC [Verrucomicrobiota bacterium]